MATTICQMPLGLNPGQAAGMLPTGFGSGFSSDVQGLGCLWWELPFVYERSSPCLCLGLTLGLQVPCGFPACVMLGGAVCMCTEVSSDSNTVFARE